MVRVVGSCSSEVLQGVLFVTCRAAVGERKRKDGKERDKGLQVIAVKK